MESVRSHTERPWGCYLPAGTLRLYVWWYPCERFPLVNAVNTQPCWRSLHRDDAAEAGRAAGAGARARRRPAPSVPGHRLRGAVQVPRRERAAPARRAGRRAAAGRRRGRLGRAHAALRPPRRAAAGAAPHAPAPGPQHRPHAVHVAHGGLCYLRKWADSACLNRRRRGGVLPGHGHAVVCACWYTRLY